MRIQKRIISLILVAIMMLPQIAIAASAKDETMELTTFSDPFVYEETDAEPGVEGEIENIPDDVVASDNLDSIELDANQFLANTENIAGASIVTIADAETELGELPDVSKLTDKIDLEVPQIPENPQTESEATDAIDDEGNNESGALFARVKTSSSSLDLNVGSSGTITVSYGGWFLGNITMRYKVYDSEGKSSYGVCGSWGSWNRKKTDMRLTGYLPGRYTVAIEMYSNSKGRVLASRNVSVNVGLGQVSISCKPNSISMEVGKTKSTVISVTGVTKEMACYGYVDNESICEFTNTELSNLTIRGLSKGSTEAYFMLYYPDLHGEVELITYCKLNITVTDGTIPDPQVTLSKTSDTIDVNETGTATVTTTGSGTLYVESSNESICVASIFNSKTLAYKGVKRGTAVITVSYKTDNGTKTASMTVYVSDDSGYHPTLTCDKSSVNVNAGDTVTVYYTVSGDFPDGTAIKWDQNSDLDNTSSSWGNWNGNTIPMNITGDSTGTDTYILKLCQVENGSIKEVFSTCTLTVTVTSPGPVKKIKITPSVSSLNLTVGDAPKSIRLNVENSTNWTISQSVSGSTCTVESINAYSTYADASISSSKKGTSTVTFTAKDKSSGETASCQVTVTSIINPGVTVTLSPEVYTITVGETVTVGVAGFQAAIIARASGLTQGKTYIWDANFYSTMVSGFSYNGIDTIYFRGLKAGSTTVRIGVKENGSDSFAAYQDLTLNIVSGNAKNFSDYNYWFKNYSADIPLSTYKIMFPDALAKSMYKADKNGHAGGLCYGMTSTSMLFNDSRSGVTVSQFNSSVSKVSALNKDNNSSKYGMSVSTFIQAMYLSQSEINTFFQKYAINWDDIDGLIDTIAKGTPVNLCFKLYKDDDYIGGHSVLGYAVDASKTKITAYDNNFPDEPITIEFTKKNGQYTGVNFPYVGYEGANKFVFNWADMSQILYCWNNRGNLYDYDTYDQNYNFFYTNSDSFNVYDEKYDLVATYSNGVLDAKDSGIMEILPDTLEGKDEDAFNKFYFPTDSYTIENCDGTIETFTSSMTNFERTAEISTDANVVEINVDDTKDICEATVDLDKAEDYSINLISFADSEESKYISGTASTNDASVAVGMNEGDFTDIVKGATISVNGGDENGVFVEATAGNGGSISPEGVNRVSKGQDIHFDITPDEGYEIADVLVNGESIGAVDSYEFFAAEDDATIYAKFKKAEKLDVLVYPTKMTYGVGETFDPTGMQLRVLYSDGTAKIVSDGYTVDAVSFDAVGEKSVTITYDGMTTKLSAKAAVQGKISIDQPSKTTIRYGDTLILHATVDPEDAKVVWSSSDPSIATVSENGAVTCLKSGKVTITARIDDGDGNPDNDESASIVLKCSGGIFWRIISFFKNLFRISRIISRSISGQFYK